MSFGTGGTDVLDVLLKLSNLQGFLAGTREAAASVRSIGTAAQEASTKSEAANIKMKGVAGLASKAFKGTALAAGAFSLASLKLSTDFQQNMELIHTQAGKPQSEVDRMTKSILAMSASGMYAQGPVKLAEGLYHLESIGLHGTQALNALKTAAQGAAVGNTDLETTSTALGAAWLTGIRGAGNLSQTMALLNATVGAGNMRMGDLVYSLGTGVLPAAKLAGLGIKDVMGALATLSDEGYRGQSAMAQLATSFHFLTDPTKKAGTALAKIGLGRFDLSTIMRTQGLGAALSTLRTHLARLSPVQAGAALGDILPAGRGRILEVLMNNVDRYGKKIQQISRTSSQFADDVAKTHQTAAFKIHAAWSQIQTAMIHFGDMLRPIAVFLAQALAKIVPWLVKMAPALAKILPYLAPIAAGFLAMRVAMMLATAAEIAFFLAGEAAAFLQLAAGVRSLSEAWALLDIVASPWLLIIGAIVAVGVAIFILYKKVGWFRHGVQAIVHGVIVAWNWMKTAAVNAFNWIVKHWKWLMLAFGPLGVVIDIVVTHFKFIKHIAEVVFHAVSTAIGRAVGAVSKAATSLFNILSWPFRWWWKHVVQPVINWVLGAVRWLVKEVGKLLGKIWGPIGKVIGDIGSVLHTGGGVLHSIGHFIGLQEGGTVLTSGMALVGERGPELLSLPRGATVAPLTTAGLRMPALAGMGQNITVQVVIDGREVARATGKYVDNRLARQ